MATELHVINTFALDDTNLARLRAVSPRLKIDHHPDAKIDDLSSDTAEVLFAGAPPADPNRLPQLRWLQTISAGVNHLEQAAPWKRGIAVTTTSGIHAVPIAEYVIGSILSYTHHLATMKAFQYARAWTPSRAIHSFPTLRGKTITVVGYGSIGREVGRMAVALGMRLLAVKRDAQALRDLGYIEPGAGDPQGALPEKIYPVSQLHEALSQADFIVISVPLTPQTRCFIDGAAFAAMKPTAYFVNICRGGVVDQDALIDALYQRRIAGATLDVTTPEPLPIDSRLYDFSNVFITPHACAYREDYDDLAVTVISENLRRYLSGAPLINQVDPQQGY